MECYLRDQCKKYKKDTSCSEPSCEYCIKQFKVDKLYNYALLSNKQKMKQSLYADADGTDENIFEYLSKLDMEKFVNDGRNLYIHSGYTGNGKTSWSIRLLQNYIGQIWYKCDLTCKALFINVPRFLLAMKNNISNEDAYAEHIKQYVQEADLVIWDDIGTKTVTPFEAEILLSIIDIRINDGKSNIYTSNLNSEEMLDILKERLYSRVVNHSENIEFHGKDKRSIL